MNPAIDDVAIKAMISILSGYVGRYLRDKKRYCFERRKQKLSDNEIFAHMEMGIQSIERLVESQDLKKEMDLESLQKSIKSLNIIWYNKELDFLASSLSEHDLKLVLKPLLFLQCLCLQNQLMHVQEGNPQTLLLPLTLRTINRCNSFWPHPEGRSMDLDNGNGASKIVWDL
ncbi:hypothetical protein Pfo_012650, partial [Paulownia fortunei]